MKRVVAIVLLLVTLCSFSACDQKETEEFRAENIRMICDLATLECYYNNVAKIEKKADNIFQVDRTMWIEYDGKVTIGIEMADVDIKVYADTVRIRMPEAKVLSIDYTFKEDSYVASSDGWLWPNKISTEEQQAGVIKGQEAMIKAIEDNKKLFQTAEERAKELIENYIKKFGEAVGREYTIQWVE